MSELSDQEFKTTLINMLRDLINKVELLSHVSRDVNLRKKKSSKLVGGMFKWEGTGVNLWLIHADVW